MGLRRSRTYKLFRETKTKALNITASLVLLASSLGGAIPLLLMQDVSAATVVTPTNTNGWGAQDGTPTFVAGPVGSDGSGSLKLTTTSEPKQNYFHAANTPLSGISGLGYKLYDTAGVPASYQLQVTGVHRTDSASTFTSLVWEPVYNGQVNGPNGGFVTESSLENGTWWSSHPIDGDPDGVNGFVSLSAIQAANPGATIVAYGVNVGSGTPNATSYVDDFSFQGDVTNFEPTLPDAPTGLRFENPSVACGGYTNVNHTTAAWDAVAGAASYNYHVDGPNGLTYDTNLSGTSNTGSFGSGQEGTYTFKVQSVDGGGLTSDWSTPCSITYDATAPTAIHNVSPANNSTLATHDFTFDWSDATDANPVSYHWEASYSPATNADGSFQTPLASHTVATSEVASPGTPDGTYYWHVQAADAASNTDTWTDTWKVTVDTTAPAVPTNLSWKTSTNVTVPNNGSTNIADGTASWQDSSSDADHYIYKYWNDIPGNQYKVGSEYTTTVSGTSLPGVFNQGEGVHHFCIEAVDAAGNTSACSATFTITYDPSAPTGLQNLSPSDGTVTTTAGLTHVDWTDATDTNGPVSYFYEVSNSPATNADGSFVSPVYQSGALSDSQIATPNTPAGLYYWHVRAVDANSNSTPWTGTWSFTIDNTAPVVTVNTLSTTDTTPTLTGTVDDSAATVSVQVNGHTYAATVTGNTWSADVTDALPVGTYDVVATATDAAGNVGTDSTTNELTITAPASSGPQTTNTSTITTTNTNNQVATTGAATNAGNTNAGDATTGDATNNNSAVLGASTTNGQTKGASTVNLQNADAKKNGSFLVLGWWWLAVVAAVGAFWFLLLGRRRSDED